MANHVNHNMSREEALYLIKLIFISILYIKVKKSILISTLYIKNTNETAFIHLL
jgi:hypothetical protein